MDELAERVERAKADAQEMEKLVADYLPFIKKETGKFGASVLEYDDRQSLGMLVFANCVKQYSPQRGGFLRYASVCIKNRLISEARKLGKGNTLYFSADDGQDVSTTLEETASLAAYSLQCEQYTLQEEIATLTGQLAQHGLSFSQLAQICPRQKRSRALCASLAHAVLQNASMLASFSRQGRLPKKELAAQMSVSEKTVEKYRQYIVALLVILQGDYPGIRAYIPGYMEVSD